MNSRYGSRRILSLTVATIAVALAAAARADTGAYDLLIQRSPVQAGDVSPNTGSHRISANASVTLTAAAQPGYRFAYWLGDVSDPSSERTTILVNEPKIVIAVFHPDRTKRAEEQIRPSGGGGGSDMLGPTAVDLQIPGWSPAGGAAKGDTKTVPTVIPVVIPEPATAALLILGLVALRTGRRSRTPPGTRKR